MSTNFRRDARQALSLLKRGQTIYTFGNGGSASIADHMACDLMKSTQGHFSVISLSSNGALLSAIGNDFGYEFTASKQIFWLDRENCAYILISSSGSSKNIIAAAKLIKFYGRPLVGFTGFDGGGLKELCDVSVHIDSKDYGEVEDYHSQVMHEMVRQVNR